MFAILLIGYNRPENILHRVAEISLNKPTKLYISIDKSPEENVSREMSMAVERAASLSNISDQIIVWNQKKNLGLAQHIKTAIDKSLELEERIIVLEDDIRIKDSFAAQLSSGYELLHGTGDFATIGAFSGVPIIGNHTKNFWRGTNYFSAWGWMIGRDIWSKYQINLPAGDMQNHLKNSDSWNGLSSTQKETWLIRFEKVRNNHQLTWDYQMQYMTFKYDLKHYLPLFRICENVGFADPRSTNTRNSQPKWMQSSLIYSREFSAKPLPRRTELFFRKVDSFTISGDSKLRKIVNKVRGTFK